MLTKIFPFLRWCREYKKEILRSDAVSGLTVALVLIPQSMAYAQLAGLPAYYGLYSSFLPPMIASLFGSSRQLATGPVAVVSLMTSASLSPLATAGSSGYVTYAILLALLVGIFQFSLGVLRLGLVVNFLSHPVVNGFTNAAAIIIATSQLSKIFGVYVDTASHHYDTVIGVFREAAHYTHWPTFFMGGFAFLIMYGLKRMSPKIPNVLVAVVVTTTISWATGFEHNRTIDFSDLESSEARMLISEYNRIMESVERLSQDRTEVKKEADSANHVQDGVEVLNAKYKLNVLNFNMERLLSQAGVRRETLRRLLFSGVEQPGGSTKFHLIKESTTGVKEEDRKWRIKVGEGRIKTEKVLMMGGGEVIGFIPKGLPSFTLPRVDFKIIMQLLPYAAIISLLGFMEAVSIAKAMAAKTGQRLDPNQELIGQGMANILGSVAKSFPTSGSFSRSAVNLQSGAVTGFSSVFTSFTVVAVLMFFTPILYHLPQSVLAAVIMMAVIGLVNVSGFFHAWEAKWYDGAISIISFLATLAFAPHLDKGIMIGVVLSLIVFLYKSMRPTVATLARHEDRSFRDCTIFGLKECKHVAMIRFDGPLFFANSSYLEDIITERMKNKKDLKHIVLVANGINEIDASGEETLSLLVDRVRSAGVDFSLSGVNEKVTKVLKRTHLWERIGDDHIYATMEKAVSVVHSLTHGDDGEQVCPLMTVCRIA